MALVAAIGFTHQVNLDVPQLSACTQVVLAHQAVEVDGRSGADIGLVMRDLGHGGQVTTQLAHDGRCFFQRRACGHVHHHLELRLVVKGQHLEHDQTGRRQDQRQGNQTGNAQTQQLAVAPARLGVEQRLENFFEQGFELGAQAGVASCRVMRMTSQRLHPHARQPGRDDKSNGQRQQHAQARIDRDRTHVRAHQTAHKRHGQQRRDHGKCCQDGGATHFIHRTGDDFTQGFSG